VSDQPDETIPMAEHLTEQSFTPTGYRAMLREGIDAGFEFRSFQDRDGDMICLLRHDVDADVGAALAMAHIEHSLGLRATYFVMLRSPVYNLLSRANTRMVREILALGHWLGLHFDETFAQELEVDYDTAIRAEAGLIENVFQTKIETVSFHQPSARVLDQTVTLSGFLNTYDRNALGSFHYISDSNQQWQEDHPIVLFSERRYAQLHLLVHPMWWVNQADSGCNALWDRAIHANLNRMQEQLLATERAYGKPRRFEITQVEDLA
jgi:hypothetical protein